MPGEPNIARMTDDEFSDWVCRRKREIAYIQAHNIMDADMVALRSENELLRKALDSAIKADCDCLQHDCVHARVWWLHRDAYRAKLRIQGEERGASYE